MANISVRRLDDGIIRGLRELAAEHGHSMEEEVRSILKAAVAPPANLGDFAATIFASTKDTTTFTLPAREPSEPIDLSE